MYRRFNTNAHPLGARGLLLYCVSHQPFVPFHFLLRFPEFVCLPILIDVPQWVLTKDRRTVEDAEVEQANPGGEPPKQNKEYNEPTHPKICCKEESSELACQSRFVL